jgi:hypothetical protein
VLIIPILQSFAHALPWGYGFLAVIAWAVVTTVTISYTSAVWLWGFSGICMGLVAAISEKREEGPGYQEATAAQPAEHERH